jgi:hypothetical protein
LIATAAEMRAATGQSVAETRKLVAESRITIERSFALIDRVNHLLAYPDRRASRF